jgi:hypothetical protein
VKLKHGTCVCTVLSALDASSSGALASHHSSAGVGLDAEPALPLHLRSLAVFGHALRYLMEHGHEHSNGSLAVTSDSQSDGCSGPSGSGDAPASVQAVLADSPAARSLLHRPAPLAVAQAQAVHAV